MDLHLRSPVTEAARRLTYGRGDVERVLVSNGRAIGVRMVDGETVTSERAVIASATPTQLYERLLADADVPAPVREAAGRFEAFQRLAKAARAKVHPGRPSVSFRVVRVGLQRAQEMRTGCGVVAALECGDPCGKSALRACRIVHRTIFPRIPVVCANPGIGRKSAEI